MDKNRAERLFEKYRNGELTEQERLDLHGWYLHHAGQAQPLADEEVFKHQMHALDEAFPFYTEAPVKKINWLPRIAAAALILLTLGAGFYFYADKQVVKAPTNAAIKHDAPYGNNKAYLTLADGKRIELTEAANGTIAVQHGIGITKTPDGQLIYQVNKTNPASTTNAAGYNIIETPRGGQYQVYLPDGTHVWLNAESSLKYQTSYAGLSPRRVELSGEAYFEVAKDKTKPFIVTTKNHTIEVLGTHFNVSAYADDANAKTTLLEGSVKIVANNVSRMLKPGQEANINKVIEINDVDVDEAIAWKNGYFRFDDERLESVMRKIARWYDVGVSYKNEDLKNETYAAVSTRFTNVSALLKMLEQTGEAKFTIENKKIIIAPKK